MNQILPCAMVVFLGLGTQAVTAGQVERQQSVSFPDHIAIPEKFGAPVRARLDHWQNMRPPEVPMPLPAPGRNMDPSPGEANE
jgi:hypothetical protein